MSAPGPTDPIGRSGPNEFDIRSSLRDHGKVSRDEAGPHPCPERRHQVKDRALRYAVQTWASAAKNYAVAARACFACFFRALAFFAVDCLDSFVALFAAHRRRAASAIRSRPSALSRCFRGFFGGGVLSADKSRLSLIPDASRSAERARSIADFWPSSWRMILLRSFMVVLWPTVTAVRPGHQTSQHSAAEATIGKIGVRMRWSMDPARSYGTITNIGSDNAIIGPACVNLYSTMDTFGSHEWTWLRRPLQWQLSAVLGTSAIKART